MLLVGSRALTHYTCGGHQRVPSDTDYICTHDEAQEWKDRNKPDRYEMNPSATTLICRWKDKKPVELMIAWPGSTNQLIYDDQAAGEQEEVIADLNTLLLLKMSHRYLKNSPHFLKTMEDIHLLRGLGAVITNPDLLKRREKETYNYPHPKLNQRKDEFFHDPYPYDHDSIHVAMAIDPLQPAYKHYQRDGTEVEVDRSKWDACSHTIKLRSIVEESLVLALERSQIPHRGKVNPRRSFELALSKVCTSITSGWWREFAWEHYYEALALYEQCQPYLARFDAAVEAGIVKPAKQLI